MASQSHSSMEAASASKALALQPLRVWIVGNLEVVLPLERYGAQVHALDNLQSLYRELAIIPCDIVLIDAAYAEEGLAVTVQHLRRREDLGVVLLVDDDMPLAINDGLWAGADACLPQRADPDLLAAKLYSLRRRLPGESAQPPEASLAGELLGGGWGLESDGWDLRAPNSQVLALT